MALQIRKATRRKAKLRLALLGPSGSGKTMSALRLAFGIGGKVGVIDTENGSADLYAEIGDYDVITLERPYTVGKYREAIAAFEDAGYTTIIVDSLSHAWSGAGGLLDKQGQLAARPGANSYAAWREITPEHNALVESLLSSPAHIITTMRVKQEYVLEENERGKKVPRKVGLQPVQRDGMEYEFTCVMDVDIDHKATATKDRTTLFADWRDTITEATGRLLQGWLDSGAEPFNVADQAMEVCKAAGLTEAGLVAFCLMVSNGAANSLDAVPRELLDRIIRTGISGETVAKCNGAAATAVRNAAAFEPDPDPDPDPTEDPDDLPAAWSG
jgi:hypothetical protein